MAFKSPVPAQEEGATYLNLIGEKVKGLFELVAIQRAEILQSIPLCIVF